MGRRHLSVERGRNTTLRPYKLTHLETHSSSVNQPECFPNFQYFLLALTMIWIFRLKTRNFSTKPFRYETYNIFRKQRNVNIFCPPLLQLDKASLHTCSKETQPRSSFWQKLLLLLCGDVEVNPGPYDKDQSHNNYEPSPRIYSMTSSSSEELYLYRGYVDNFSSNKTQLRKVVQVYDSSNESWREVPTAGSPPPGLRSGAATSSNHILYLYGGYDGTSHSNSLHQLDIRSMTWTTLSHSHDNGPMRKTGCRMIYYNNSLILIGGYGERLSELQSESQFIESFYKRGCGWTNEIHMYNISQGTWSSPLITGSRPSPRTYFTLTCISLTHAVLFGGIANFIKLNDTYLIDLAHMSFTKLVHPDGASLPSLRSHHVAVCLDYGTTHPQLLIYGGLDDKSKVFSDVWCLDVSTKNWYEISETTLQPRYGHCAAAFEINSELTEVVLFGGRNQPYNSIADTTILRLEKVPVSTASSLCFPKWRITEVISKSELRNKDRLIEKQLMKEKQMEMACQEAIEKQISVDLSVGRMNFLGLPRSGKSSTLHRLLGEFLNIKEANMGKEEPSTGVAERKRFFIQSMSKTFGFAQHGKWRKKSLTGETSILNDIIQQAVQVDTKLQQASQFISQAAEVTSENNKHSHNAVTTTQTATSNTSATANTSEASTALDVAEVYPNYKRAMAAKDSEEVKYLLKDTMYLITTDHGGQTEIMDLMSRFLMGPSLHLIFSRLTDPLDNVYKMYTTNEEGVHTDKEDSIVTLKEVIFQTLASIACMKDTDDKITANQQKLGGDTIITPKAMFVGTFRDKISQAQFDERDQILQEKIKQTDFYNQDIVEYASKEHLTLELDNMNGTSEEINKARNIFENCIKKNFGRIRIPCSWLMLSIVMRSKEKRTMSLQDCREISESLHISPSDLPTALWFLHYRVGMLLHYPEVKDFENVIICDIKVIFDAATKLVKETFTFENCGRRVADMFKNTAQFTVNDLQKATKGNVDEIISMEMIITLFEHHNILAPLPITQDRSKVTYFMPSILKSATINELKEVPASSDVAPLVYRYKCGYLPLGVFSSLIISLVSKTELQWRIKEGCPCRRNMMTFFIENGDYDTVTLICCASFIEVKLYRVSFNTRTSVVCSHIRNTLITILTEVNASLKYQSATLQYGFICPAPHKAACTESHLCILENVEFKNMLCLKDQTSIIPLVQPEHTIWFEKDEVCPTNVAIPLMQGEQSYPFIMRSLIILKWTDSDNKVQKMSIIDEISQKWRDISDLLGISLAKTEQIEMDKNNVRDRCREVLKLWLSNEDGVYHYSLTWEGLIELLQDLELANLADKIQSIVYQTQ